MLRVVDGPVADGRNDLANYQQCIAVQVVGGRAGHDDGASKMEAGEDDRQWCTSPLVDAEAKPDA